MLESWQLAPEWWQHPGAQSTSPKPCARTNKTGCQRTVYSKWPSCRKRTSCLIKTTKTPRLFLFDFFVLRLESSLPPNITTKEHMENIVVWHRILLLLYHIKAKTRGYLLQNRHPISTSPLNCPAGHYSHALQQKAAQWALVTASPAPLSPCFVHDSGNKYKV